MKSFNSTVILIAALFIMGCATNKTASTSEEAAPTAGDSSSERPTGTRTAYDGATGPSLLMERYRSGEIPGLHD